MGQYYMIVNIDKKQFIHPHKLGNGLKLMEFASSSNGVMTALALLLAHGNGRGGGDFREDSPLIGAWAGDRIVITGDYADTGDFITEEETRKARAAYIEREELSEDQVAEARDMNLYDVVHYGGYEDISKAIRAVMEQDEWIKERMHKSWSHD